MSTVQPPQDFNPVALAVSLGAFTLLFLMGMLLISAYDAFRAGRAEKHEEQLEREVDRASEELRRLSRRLAEMQDEERRRLAAELHDIVGQNLSALNAELALIRKELPPGSPAGLSDKLADATQLVRQSVEAVRNVMTQLRPPGLDELGLAAALRWHAEGLKARTGVTVSVDADESLPRPSRAVEDAVLRIYLEALTNVAKHAQAREVRVTLGARNGAVTLAIADDGRGFDAAAPLRRDEISGWGLLIMIERAGAIGGKLEVHSAPGAGTRVEFTISKEKWS